MATAKPRPELQPMARAIVAAMTAKGLTTTQLNALLGSHRSPAMGDGSLPPDRAVPRSADRDIGAVPRGRADRQLRAGPSPARPVPRRARRAQARAGPGAQTSLSDAHLEISEAGPAERALVSWAGVPEPPPRPKPPAPRAASPFSATMHADGTMRVTVDVTLPFAQATALMQMLFSANVLLAPEPAAATQEDA
jgi:hypothetical protein